MKMEDRIFFLLQNLSVCEIRVCRSNGHLAKPLAEKKLIALHKKLANFFSFQKN